MPDSIFMDWHGWMDETLVGVPFFFVFKASAVLTFYFKVYLHPQVSAAALNFKLWFHVGTMKM